MQAGVQFPLGLLEQLLEAIEDLAGLAAGDFLGRLYLGVPTHVAQYGDFAMPRPGENRSPQKLTVEIFDRCQPGATLDALAFAASGAMRPVWSFPMQARLKSLLRSGALIAAFALPVAAHAAGELMVYKDPYCGCCSAWIDHMKAAGFEVKFEDRSDVNRIKQSLGLPRELASCHTALIDGYVIEGHVPAADVKRLLEEKPAVVGIAVPGMPMGSPGMEGPTSQPYSVVSFTREGRTTVFSRH